MRKKGKLGFIIWGIVSIILVVAMIAANVVTTTYKSIISTYLNQPMTEILGGDSGDEAVYYDAELSEQQLVKQGKKLCEEIVSEGIVLLENNDMEDGTKALPLRDNERSVHFFSMSSFDFINGGVGSGSIDDSSALRLKDVFAEAGFINLATK